MPTPLRNQLAHGCMMLALSLGACTSPPRPVHPVDAGGVPDAGTPGARAEQAPEARNPSVATADLEIQCPLRSALRPAQGPLTGARAVTLTNRGSPPAELTHPDVHGLRFVDTTTGTSHAVMHPCDCAFLLGL